MIGLQEQINLQTDLSQGFMHINYERKTKRTIYDICDVCGRILKTGTLRGQHTSIDIQDLQPDAYIFLILDGDRAISRKFMVRV